MVTTLPFAHSSTSGGTSSGHGEVELTAGHRGAVQFKLLNNVFNALNSMALSIALFCAAASASNDQKNIFVRFVRSVPRLSKRLGVQFQFFCAWVAGFLGAAWRRVLCGASDCKSL
jgi:hypothetical protein